MFGKIGRAETATDPAPLSMIETTVRLKDPAEWRPGMTKEKLVEEMDRAVRFPGLTNAWTMPIKTRIDMLSTGIKTPVGVKIAGPDLATLERLGKEVEAVVRGPSGYALGVRRAGDGGQLLRLQDRSRRGRSLRADGRRRSGRHPVGDRRHERLMDGRGARALPDQPPLPARAARRSAALREILVATPSGLQVPLGQLAEVDIHQGPPAIKSENARPNAWVYVDLKTADVGGWVERARAEVEQRVELPAGYTIFWSGQYEYMQRAKARLMVIVPITLLVIFLILYINTKSLTKTAIVLLAVPFSMVGAVWLIWALGYNWSVAVWVGLIALAGLDAETGVVMLLYLDIAFERWKQQGKMATFADLAAAVEHGAVQRIRPKMMTVAAILVSLVPILWATGTGADVMRRIAAPMIGGVFSSFVGELVVYPSIYFIWRSIGLRRSPLFPGPAGNGGPTAALPEGEPS